MQFEQPVRVHRIEAGERLIAHHTLERGIVEELVRRQVRVVLDIVADADRQPADILDPGRARERFLEAPA